MNKINASHIMDLVEHLSFCDNILVMPHGALTHFIREIE
jgi:hypothetical protein